MSNTDWTPTDAFWEYLGIGVLILGMTVCTLLLAGGLIYLGGIA